MLILEISSKLSIEMMMHQIVAIILSVFLGWGISRLNVMRERKKNKLEKEENDKKAQERDDLLIGEIKSFNDKLNNLTLVFFEFKENVEFKSRLMNSMRAIATNIIDYNVDLKSEYKHMLTLLAREFEDFALRFYYSDMRGVSHEISPFLRIDMDSRVVKFEERIERHQTKPKAYTYSTGKEVKIEFDEYIKKSKLKDKIELLLMLLEKNGLTPDKVVEEFEKFIGGFFKTFIHIINEWEDLKEYNPAKHKLEKNKV